MDLDLQGKRALITGGSAGIGEATARRLAAEGCDIILVARSQEKLATVKQTIEAETGRKVDILAADLSARDAHAIVAETFPDIDILVNNAGDDPTGTLAEIDDDRWRAAWDLKVFGYTNLCRDYYPLMKARGGGVIVNVIGVAHLVRDTRYICGAMSTAAMTVLSQVLGSRSLEDGIRVVGVGPGVTATPRVLRGRHILQNNGVASQQDTALEDHADSLARTLGLARSGRAEEIAALIAFVSSPRANYMTGTVVYSDGGWSRT